MLKTYIYVKRTKRNTSHRQRNSFVRIAWHSWKIVICIYLNFETMRTYMYMYSITKLSITLVEWIEIGKNSIIGNWLSSAFTALGIHHKVWTTIDNFVMMNEKQKSAPGSNSWQTMPSQHAHFQRCHSKNCGIFRF